MSRWRAPSALRSPISRVRSRTLDQHDVRDPDPADEQRDAGDRGQHQGQQPEDAPDGAEDLGLGDGGELLARVLLLQRAHQRGRCSDVDPLGRRRLDRQARRCVSTPKQPLRRGHRDVHLVVAAHAERRARLGRRLRCTRNRTPAMRPDRPSGSTVAEELLGDVRAEHGDPPPGVDVGRRGGTAPRASGRLKTYGTFSLVPLTVANTSAAADADRLSGRHRRRDRTRIADHPAEQLDVVEASSRLTLGAEPNSNRPGSTKMRFEPSPSTWLSTSCLAPLPIATRTTTAPTPMMTPSIVSALRSRLARKRLQRDPERLADSHRPASAPSAGRAEGPLSRLDQAVADPDLATRPRPRSRRRA